MAFITARRSFHTYCSRVTVAIGGRKAEDWLRRINSQLSKPRPAPKSRQRSHHLLLLSGKSGNKQNFACHFDNFFFLLAPSSLFKASFTDFFFAGKVLLKQVKSAAPSAPTPRPDLTEGRAPLPRPSRESPRRRTSRFQRRRTEGCDKTEAAAQFRGTPRVATPRKGLREATRSPGGLREAARRPQPL